MDGYVQRRCLDNGTWQIDWPTGLIKSYNSCLPQNISVETKQQEKFEYDANDDVCYYTKIKINHKNKN